MGPIPGGRRPVVEPACYEPDGTGVNYRIEKADGGYYINGTVRGGLHHDLFIGVYGDSIDVGGTIGGNRVAYEIHRDRYRVEVRPRGANVHVAQIERGSDRAVTITIEEPSPKSP